MMNFFRFFLSLAFVRQMVLSIFVLILFIYLMLLILKVITYHNDMQEVPNLKGISIIKLEEIIKTKNLRYEIIDSSKFTSKFKPLSVIEHLPSAGQLVKKNRKIYVTLNPSGYRRISVPNVVQITRRNAEVKLKSVGFSIGDILYKNNIGRDMVLEIRYRGESIEPGTLLQKTTKIDLVLGNGRRK